MLIFLRIFSRPKNNSFDYVLHIDEEVVGGSRDGEEATNIQKLSDGDTEITVRKSVLKMLYVY